MSIRAKCWSMIIVAILVASVFTGCGGENKAIAQDKFYAVEVKESPVSADPQQAIEAIYADHEYIAEELTESYLAKNTNINIDNLIEVFGKISDAKGVLADIIILKPLPGVRDDVRNQLNLYKENRIKEFENYDILEAHDIAKNAVVYDQGEYLILLMTEDNAQAQTLVDEHIPH